MKKRVYVYSYGGEAWNDKIYRELGWIDGIFGGATGNFKDVIKGLQMGNYILSTAIPITNYPDSVVEKPDDDNEDGLDFDDEMKNLLPGFTVYQDYKKKKIWMEIYILLRIDKPLNKTEAYDSIRYFFPDVKPNDYIESLDFVSNVTGYNNLERLEIPSRYIFDYKNKEFVQKFTTY